MSKNSIYTNESDVLEKVYIDGVTGPFRILMPGETGRDPKKPVDSDRPDVEPESD